MTAPDSPSAPPTSAARVARAREAKQTCASKGARVTDSGPSEYACGAPAMGGIDGQWLHLVWHAFAEARRDALDEAAKACRRMPRNPFVDGLTLQAAADAILALKEPR